MHISFSGSAIRFCQNLNKTIRFFTPCIFKSALSQSATCPTSARVPLGPRVNRMFQQDSGSLEWVALCDHSYDTSQSWQLFEKCQMTLTVSRRARAHTWKKNKSNQSTHLLFWSFRLWDALGVTEVHVSEYACGPFSVRLVQYAGGETVCYVVSLLLLSWILVYCSTSFQFFENHQAAVCSIEKLRDWRGEVLEALPTCGYSEDVSLSRKMSAVSRSRFAISLQIITKVNNVQKSRRIMQIKEWRNLCECLLPSLVPPLIKTIMMYLLLPLLSSPWGRLQLLTH